jgi:dTDP-4-dehydrorhamnose reductase
LLPSALVIRAGSLFGPWNDGNPLGSALRSLELGTPPAAFSEEVVSPTYIPDLVNVSLDLLIDGEKGIWHLANEGATTWPALISRVAEMAALPPSLAGPATAVELGSLARRPAYGVLDSERGRLLPSLEDAVQRYAVERGRLREATGARQAL